MDGVKRGIAIGISDIKSDAIHFRYRDKTWDFSTFEVVPHIAKYNGIYYEASVKKLKKLAEELGNGL